MMYIHKEKALRAAVLRIAYKLSRGDTGERVRCTDICEMAEADGHDFAMANKMVNHLLDSGALRQADMADYCRITEHGIAEARRLIEST